MNLRIDQRIVPIVVAPKTLLMPATKKFIADVVLVGAWVNRNLRRGIWTGIDGITPGNLFNAVSV